MTDASGESDDELAPILFTRLLGAVIACVLTELTLCALARLYAGQGGFLRAFGDDDPGDLVALGASLGFGLALGLGLGAADEARARGGPLAALAAALAALPLLAALTLYGASFALKDSPEARLELTLVALGRPSMWLFSGLVGLFALSIHGAFVVARARGLGAAEQTFAMAFAATVALVAVAPATLFFWTGGPPWENGLLPLLVLARAPILPLASRLGDAVALSLRRRLLGLRSPWSWTRLSRPNAAARAWFTCVRSVLREPPIEGVARRVAHGVERSGEVLGVASLLLTVVAFSSVVFAAIGFDQVFRRAADLLRFAGDRATWLVVPSAYGSALLVGLVLVTLFAPALRQTSPARSARRALVASTVILTATVLSLPPRPAYAYWSSHPWDDLFQTAVLALVCARVVPGAFLLALIGAYLSVGGYGRHTRIYPPAETWPYGFPLTPWVWGADGLQVATATVGLCLVVAGAGLSGGGRRLVSALFTGVGALGAGAAALVLLMDELGVRGYWEEGAFVDVFLPALLGGVAGALAARGGRVARASFVTAALLLPLGLNRAIDASFTPSELPTKLALLRASRGDPSAMLDVAQRYDVGHEVVASSQQASAWYRRAAEAGLPKAMHRWGCRLASGRGERRDLVAAREWLTRAASAGHVPAAERLAKLADEASPQPQPPR